MSASSYLNRKTPGVYINEIPAFGNSIVGVPTAVPVFIGYTEFAADPVTGASLLNTPVSISSMVEFSQFFGGRPPVSFKVALATTGNKPDFYAMATPSGGKSPTSNGYTLTYSSSASASSHFSLYWTMQLFFANGGGQCFVVSVGNYSGSISKADLEMGLTQAGYATGPTMIVIPEACQLLDADYTVIAQGMLNQAATLQDRVAILDLPDCLIANTDGLLKTSQGTLETAILPSAANLSYGAAYAPALNSTIIDESDINYTNFKDDSGAIQAILTTQADSIFANDSTNKTNIENIIKSAFPASGADPAPSTQEIIQNDNLLKRALPLYLRLKQLAANRMNVLPPSGAIAGVWTKNDNQRGVWNAPANMALAEVASPLYIMNNEEQAGFNLPTNGQSIGIIRAQPGRGNIVWGARTLDGNSGDYRYVQVRRTLIYIEQSIKLALQQYVFDANDATTWTQVVSSISSFLNGLWQQGGLMGSKPSEAYSVKCGLGSTMTAQNVLDGYMIVAVTLQMIHPAEFIELTFTQTMSS
ncbi:MAG: phage tail sheath family protein [Acetobacteraceae bacterium]|jgi:phage tail sheath protein FI